MARKIVQKSLELFQSLTTSTSDSPEMCYILDLPPEIVQCITEHISIRDLISFSRTCRTFYTLINSDAFWAHRIGCQFPPSVVQLYTSDVFQQPEYVESEDAPRESGFEHTASEYDFDKAAKNSATHYNDEAIERRHAKMYVSKEDFFNILQYFQYKKPKRDLEVPLMKLMYFYLIDRKRQAAIEMDVVHRNDEYLVEQTDQDSLKGRIISLQSVCWLEITGRFPHVIMPGKYQILWRMKCQQNNVRMWADTEFMVVPSHGKLSVHRVSENDFRNYVLLHSNRWFLINMGHVIIYEPSTVLLAVRNWRNGNWKYGISWDCIELKIVS